MKKTKLLLSSILLILCLSLKAEAFWFKPIIEIDFNTTDPNASLALIAGKKYRIKFYNIDCSGCQTILKTEAGISNLLNIRTELKRVGTKSLNTHHVIDVQKTQTPQTGYVNLEAIHGTYSQRIKVDVSTEEACNLR